ncbi:MAG TPA: HAD-IIA family hydrolase [Clostridiales bacterium]|nr:HAD-IIA family hydrolase [Clostridiales bacterium]
MIYIENTDKIAAYPNKDTSLLKNKKLFILDMDGTFYLGDRILEGSLDFINKLKETGREFLFFTNNASKTPEFYIKKLQKMGCEIIKKNIATAGDVTIEYLLENYNGKKVYLVGTPLLEESFRKAGINLVLDKSENKFRQGSEERSGEGSGERSEEKSGEGSEEKSNGKTDEKLDEKPDVVVVSFDLTLTYEKISRACTFIREGAVFIATHMDLNCPTEDGFIPDCGSICAMVTASTGVKPRYLGKPFEETIEMIEHITGYTKDEMVIIGDRLYTDIATGFNNGVASILVLTGETKLEDLEESQIKPDYVFPSLSSVIQWI